MIMTSNTCAANNKNFDDIPLTDIHGRKHYFKRASNKPGYFDIQDCQPLIDGRVPGRDGVLPSAVYYTNEEVADFITQAEVRQRRLEDAEAALRGWIEFRQAWSRKASK